MADKNSNLVQVKNYSTAIVGQDIEDILTQVEEHYRNAQFKQAKRLCNEVLQFEPENLLALKQLGIISHRLNELDDAFECFSKVTELDPEDATAFYNLGHTCIKLNNLDLAFAAFSKTVELNPSHARAFNNLGVILERRGDFEQAVEYFFDAGELDREHALSRMHLVATLFSLHRLEECRQVIDQSLKVSSLTPDQRGNLLVDRALIAWLQADIDTCQRVLRLCKHVLNHMQSPEIYAQPYINLIIDLLEYRLKNAAQYESRFDRDIYYLGDQQSLIVSDYVLNFNDLKYRVRSLLVADARISDFVDNQAMNVESNNGGIAQGVMLDAMKGHRVSVSFAAAIEEIPKNSSVLLGFGELDCRVSHGIYAYTRKNKVDVDEYLQSLATAYIQHVHKLCDAKKLKIIVVGIPAYNSDIQDLSPKEQQKLLYITEALNEFVAEAALAKSYRYLDVYTATVGENGQSNKLFHLTENYLVPNALQMVFDQYLLEADSSS